MNHYYYRLESLLKYLLLELRVYNLKKNIKISQIFTIINYN